MYDNDPYYGLKFGSYTYVIPAHKVKNPSSFFYLVESYNGGPGTQTETGSYTIRPNTDWCPIYFHHGSSICNTLFLDGHAAPLSLTEMLKLPNADPYKSKTYYFYRKNSGVNLKL